MLESDIGQHLYVERSVVLGKPGVQEAHFNDLFFNNLNYDLETFL